MNKKSFLYILLLAATLGGCTNREIELPDTTQGRIITFTSAMPSGSSPTRIAFTQEGKNINLTWEEGDQIQLSAVQNGIWVKQTVTVRNLSTDRKTASFDFVIPESFTGETFDLYGVYGGLGVSTDQPNIALFPSNPGNNGSLAAIQSNRGAMLRFKKLNINTQNPSIQVAFEHLGSLFCIKLKNTGTTALEQVSQLVLSAAEGGWMYNTGTGGAAYDLVTDSFIAPVIADSAISFTLPESALAANETIDFWGWYVPNTSMNCPAIQVRLKNAGLNTIAVGSNAKAGQSKPLSKGKCYYLYAGWDGSRLQFTDSAFVTPPTLEDATILGDVLCSEPGDGYIGMVYSKSGTLYYNTVSTGGTWSGETSLGAGSEAKMKIDQEGFPHIVFRSSDNRIAYIKKTASGWTSAEYIGSNNSGSCYKPDIAVDSAGFAHITYTDTQGDLGIYYRDDIMYAVNSSGSFVKTLIFNGYYEHMGGSDYTGQYYNGGSFIELDKNGIYYIMTYFEGYARWSGHTDREYSVKFISGAGASGSSTVYYAGTTAQGSRYAAYDLAFDGQQIKALYRDNNSHITVGLSVNGATITPTGSATITTSITPVSLSASTSALLVGGVAGTSLFSKYNEVEETYTSAVKNSKAFAVLLNGTPYLVYTHTTDGKIKIQKAKML